MSERRASSFIGLIGLGIVLALSTASHPAEAKTLIGSCPYTITLPGTYVVSRNLNCPGDEAAIEITADNVRLLLGRRTLTGSGEGVGVRALGTSEDPIEGLRISGGTVTGFDAGLTIVNAPEAEISQVTAQDNSFNGIRIDDSPGAQLLRNTVRGSQRGLFTKGCDGCLVRGNHAIANAGAIGSDGIVLDRTSGARVESNVATGNRDDGIELITSSTGNLIRLNVVTSNGGSGIDVAFGSTNNRLLLNLATGNNADGVGTDEDLADRNSGCLNTWRANRFVTDTEGDGPRQGCIR